MVLVFVEKISNRIAYTFDFIFKSRGIGYEITESEDLFLESTLKKLNYSSKVFESFTIQPSGLLSENKWRKIQPIKNKFHQFDCLSFDGITDPIASIFYVLTCYEEYNSEKLDQHDRFPFAESCLNTNEWIELAICDRWATEVLNLLDVKAIKKEVEIIPTFDIDNTFAYQYKKGAQKYLSVLRDLVQLNFNRLSERRRVNKGQHDPYDTFNKIKKIAQKFPQTKLFWLVGERSEKDRNIPISNCNHQALMKEMDQHAEVNLHPSYASNSNVEVIQKEKESLEEVLGRKVTNSRQHFLRFQLPRTYQSLDNLGFRDEYSMGFAEQAGFRCGTARKHQWFDLSKDNVVDYQIHPFVYMDGTLNEYMQLSIEESKTKIKQLFDEVNRFGGDFIFLWHNETIGDYQKWAGWSSVLDFTLNLKDE